MISYCTTVYNEKEYIKILLSKLNKVLCQDEEIIVIQTYREDKEKYEDFFTEIKEIILSYTKNLTYETFHFQASSTGWNSVKNYMNGLSTKPYIFNLDSDEDYPEMSFHFIRDVVKHSGLDLAFIPRINTVEGLTEEDIKKWNWHVNEKGWINWPDYQPRLYRNNRNIIWGNGPHDGIIGAHSVIALEAIEDLAIIHKKNIFRQRSQNNLYDKILNNKETNE